MDVRESLRCVNGRKCRDLSFLLEVSSLRLLDKRKLLHVQPYAFAHALVCPHRSELLCSPMCVVPDISRPLDILILLFYYCWDYRTIMGHGGL